MNRAKTSRRQFIQHTAALAAFSIVPRHVLGNGQTPPSEKLNIACVGIGGKGFSDAQGAASQNIYALCDVDDRQAARAFNEFPKAKRYRDWRIMLEKEPHIDAVMIATPDHCHAIIALAAMKLGKHVYCQKPLTHTVEEAQLLGQAAQTTKLATQMGNQGHASEATARIQEVIADGAIGPVRQVHVWTDRPMQGMFGEYWPQGVDRPNAKPAVPDHLDWDVWLGPAPERPYHGAYHPFRWRGWWDFGTGALGDIGCHALDSVFRALKLDYPDSVQAACSRVNKETYPIASVVTYTFPARGTLPPVTVTWYDGGLKPPRPDELEPGRQLGDGGTLYVGDNGKILDGHFIPDSRMRDYTPPPKTVPRSIGHYEEWLAACKTGSPTGSNFVFAGRLTEVVMMGNIALRVDLREQLSRQKLLWDPAAKQFSNLPEANAFLKKPYRPGWSLAAV